MANGGLGADVPIWFRNEYKVKKLSGEAFAAWVKVACWCIANQQDGFFPADITTVEPDISRNGLEELFQQGFVKTHSVDWHLLTDYERTQSSAREIAQRLEASRESNRKRQKRYREKQLEDDDVRDRNAIHNVTHNVTQDVIHNATGGVSPSHEPALRDRNVTPVRVRGREREETQSSFENSNAYDFPNGDEWRTATERATSGFSGYCGRCQSETGELVPVAPGEAFCQSHLSKALENCAA